jgi:hypothetical protein
MGQPDRGNAVELNNNILPVGHRISQVLASAVANCIDFCKNRLTRVIALWCALGAKAWTATFFFPLQLWKNKVFHPVFEEICPESTFAPVFGTVVACNKSGSGTWRNYETSR